MQKLFLDHISMASMTAGSSSQFGSPQAQRDHHHTSTSPGPLHMSDLGPRTASPTSRPPRLQPLQREPGAAKTKRKKTRRKRDVEQRGERGEIEGSEGTPGETPELTSYSDPLLEASTLQQMQARLDPLYCATPSTNAPQSGTDGHSITTISSGSESLPVRGTVDEERVEQRRRRGDQRVVAAEQGGREEGEGQARKPHSMSRRRRHRDSGSGTSEMAARQEELEEQERVEEGAGLTATVDDDGHENNSPLPEMFQGLPAPQYYPPPEEIHDEGGERVGEAIITGAVSPLPTTLTQHQSPNVVFVERTDGRGFDVRRKLSSVVPDDVTCGGPEKDMTSELFAYYSHRFVQRISLTAHGLVAGLSLWDCVVCNVLGSLRGHHLNLLQSYHPLSLPAHSLYTLLLSLALVSLLDRLDLAKLGKQCWQFTLCSLPGLAIFTATALTAIALVVSLSVAVIDDRISLYPDQPSLWPDIVAPLNLTSTNSTPPILTTHTSSQEDTVYIPTDDDPMTSRLRLWLGLSVFRSICCVLGWGLLVCVSDHDRTEEYISGMVDSSSNQQQPRAPTGSPTTTTSNQNPTNTAQTTTTSNQNTAPTTTTPTPSPTVHTET